MKTIDEIRNQVDQMGMIINAPKKYLQLHNRAIGDGTPYVVISEKYEYIASERGVLISREETSDIEELLYWVFDDITSKMAGEYELNNRQKYVDTRRLRFQEQIRLMVMLSDSWGERTKNKFDKILTRNPYVDDNINSKGRTFLDNLKGILKLKD